MSDTSLGHNFFVVVLLLMPPSSTTLSTSLLADDMEMSLGNHRVWYIDANTSVVLTLFCTIETTTDCLVRPGSKASLFVRVRTTFFESERKTDEFDVSVSI